MELKEGLIKLRYHFDCGHPTNGLCATLNNLHRDDTITTEVYEEIHSLLREEAKTKTHLWSYERGNARKVIAEYNGVDYFIWQPVWERKSIGLQERLEWLDNWIGEL